HLGVAGFLRAVVLDDHADPDVILVVLPRLREPGLGVAPRPELRAYLRIESPDLFRERQPEDLFGAAALRPERGDDPAAWSGAARPDGAIEEEIHDGEVADQDEATGRDKRAAAHEQTA